MNAFMNKVQLTYLLFHTAQYIFFYLHHYRHLRLSLYIKLPLRISVLISSRVLLLLSLTTSLNTLPHSDKPHPPMSLLLP